MRTISHHFKPNGMVCNAAQQQIHACATHPNALLTAPLPNTASGQHALGNRVVVAVLDFELCLALCAMVGNHARPLNKHLQYSGLPVTAPGRGGSGARARHHVAVVCQRAYAL